MSHVLSTDRPQTYILSCTSRTEILDMGTHILLAPHLPDTVLPSSRSYTQAQVASAHKLQADDGYASSAQ